ncbi:MAG: hypothetical protein LBD25_08150 [Coriobacteriales bacterium]|jgi:hypothetical protein|nr:hypothetical protein [Coriobacteriales bacterium]
MDRLLDMPYRAMPAFSLDQDMVPEPDRTLDLHAGPADVIARSPVIVSCVFEGDRRYQYQSFLSDMRVVRVYQGDGIAVGQILPVFEPARIVKDSPTSQYAMPSGMYASGYVMMEEGGTYLLFLAAKVYAAEEDRTGKPTEYVMQEHPYANLA